MKKIQIFNTPNGRRERNRKKKLKELYYTIPFILFFFFFLKIFNRENENVIPLFENLSRRE